VISLLQRVTQAQVEVDSVVVGAIGAGLLVLVGVEPDDTPAQSDRLLDRILGYRVFPDSDGRMNCSLAETGGGLLLVPQFTLAADTRKGARPSFATAAPPELGERLFDYLVSQAVSRHANTKQGRFGAHMLVSLVNDGPVTFSLTARAATPRPRHRDNP
jgi:D-tyrosyl-tRNA(Tyr) deacylase